MDCTTSILIAVTLLVLTLWLYKWLFASWNHWTSKGIPSVPGCLPIVGNALPLIRSQENLATLCRSIYEANRGKSMVGFYNMTEPVLMLREPELVKTVLQSSFSSFHDNGNILDLESDPLIGRDIFFARGQAWKESRAHFVSAFTVKRMKIMSLVVAKVCQKLENHLAEKIANKDYQEIEAKLLFGRYVSEVAANIVLSMDGDSFADNYKGTLLDSMKLTFEGKTNAFLTNNILSNLLPALKKFSETSLISPEIDKFFRKLVQDLENSRDKDGVPRNDVLQLMRDLENTGKIPREEYLAHTLTFIVESYGTSTLVLSFVFYEIAKHPKVQDRLREEIQTILAKHDGQLNYDSLNEMRYAEQVVNETLRLFPPAGHLSKLCTKEYRLEGSDGLNLNVAPETHVIIPVMGLHMDPDIWENPEEFNPDRFTKSNVENRHKFSFLPLGEGPRVCPGARLGYTQIKAAIATILSKYRVELSPKIQEPLRIDPTYFMTDVVGGIWIRLRSL